jgi:hypothetical protein
VDWLAYDADQRAEGSLAVVKEVARERPSLDGNISHNDYIVTFYDIMWLTPTAERHHGHTAPRESPSRSLIDLRKIPIASPQSLASSLTAERPRGYDTTRVPLTLVDGPTEHSIHFSPFTHLVCVSSTTYRFFSTTPHRLLSPSQHRNTRTNLSQSNNRSTSPQQQHTVNYHDVLSRPEREGALLPCRKAHSRQPH